jgi:hypothetical protein
MDRERRGALGPLLLANALPIAAVVLFLILRAQGKASLQALPEASFLPLGLVGVAIFAIVALGWVVFPRLRELRRAARSRATGFFGFFWGGISFFLLVDMAALATLVLGLFATEIVLLVRFALMTTKK